MIDIGHVFKSLIWDALVTSVLEALFAAVPFLSWGPLRAITTTIVRWVADKMFDGIDEFIDLQAIAFRKLELAHAYAKVTLELKKVAQEKGTDSEEFKNGVETAKAALRDFIKFNA